MTDAVRATPAAAAGGSPMLPLKEFQERARDFLLDVVEDTAAKIETATTRRRDIALAQGVSLLRAPTGSGKTLVIGRTLERTVGRLPRRTVWFWFAPFAGLVAQTREALSAQCPALHVRDLRDDRLCQASRDGDVFVATWASVAAANRDSRLIRQDSETLPSVDLLAAWLRAEGWYVGAVVDEAHLNFGTSAKRAAEFFLDVLCPDFTILATATPKDDELERFERLAGIERVNRYEIPRADVVHACLNKVGVKTIHFRPDPKDENLLDMGEVALYAGLARHRQVRRALEEAGVALQPLLMVQVENAARGEPDPADRARDFLKAQGVPDEAIAVHTTGEPDPLFHALAYDEKVEVLIFKLAAATGFDAPRAWTLVSLRRSAGVEFGHQVIGRIMRVHRAVQPLHPYAASPTREPGVLDYGYVFLANPAQQIGLATAAFEIQAIRNSVEAVTDNVTVIELGGAKAVLLDPAGGFSELLDPPAEPGSGQAAPHQWPTAGSAAAGAVSRPPEGGSDGRVRAAALRAQTWLDLAGGTGDPAPRPPRPGAAADWTLEEPRAEPGWTPPGRTAYRLRSDIAFPRSLAREVMPRTMEGLVSCIAQRIRIDDEAVALVNRTRGKVVVTEEDLFGSARTTSRESVPISAVRLSQQAQLAFRFNDSIDERDLKPALLARLRREFDERGYEVPQERDLRRAVDLLAMARPELFHEACRGCLAQVVEVRQDEQIPEFYEGPTLLARAEKGLYGVFPADMNEEELAFARVLDEDRSGTVLWWLRNVSNARWAVSIVLPTGKLHYPDFVVGVDARRKSRDAIALVEVKDDGRTGRLFSTVNTDKVRTEHRDYRSALMVFRDERGDWYNVAYRAEIQRHHVGKRFDVAELVWSQQ